MLLKLNLSFFFLKSAAEFSENLYHAASLPNSPRVPQYANQSIPESNAPPFSTLYRPPRYFRENRKPLFLPGVRREDEADCGRQNTF